MEIIPAALDGVNLTASLPRARTTRRLSGPPAGVTAYVLVRSAFGFGDSHRLL